MKDEKKKLKIIATHRNTDFNSKLQLLRHWFEPLHHISKNTSSGNKYWLQIQINN